MKKQILAYFSIMIIYFIIDIAYQFMFGMNFAQGQYKAAGIEHIYAQGLRYPILLLVFFVMIAYGNLKLAVEPAWEKQNANLAAKNGFILGLCSYGTLGLANTWSLDNFPLQLMCEIILEGILFSPIASYITAKWLMNK